MRPVVRSPTRAVPSGSNVTPVGASRLVATTPEPAVLDGLDEPGELGTVVGVPPGAPGGPPGWLGCVPRGPASRLMDGCGTQVGLASAPAPQAASSPPAPSSATTRHGIGRMRPSLPCVPVWVHPTT